MDLSVWSDQFILLFRLFTVFKFKWLAMVQKRSNRFRTLLKKVKKKSEEALWIMLWIVVYSVVLTFNYSWAVLVSTILFWYYFILYNFFCIKLTSWPKWIRAATGLGHNRITFRQVVHQACIKHAVCNIQRAVNVLSWVTSYI